MQFIKGFVGIASHLKAFFLSSVEFSKFNKFHKDDRKDRDRSNNQTGTQGTIAPQSPNLINSTNIYSVSDKLSAALDFGHAEYIAIYNSGDTVVSESYAIVNPGNAGFVLDIALPMQDRWLTGISGPAKKIEAVVQIQTIAQCFVNPKFFILF